MMRRSSRRWRSAAWIAAAVLTVVLGPVAPAWSATATPAANTLRLGYTAEPDNLNPFIGYSTSAYEIWHLNYDLLVGYSAKDNAPAPEYATSWSTSPDGLTWTFKIRKGMAWQDGVPATARDAAFTYNYIIENDMTAFSSFTKGIERAVAVDDYTLEIRCSAPKANILRLWIPILPEHIWSKVDPKEAANKYANKPPIIGTGPFQLVEWKKGSYARMVANPSYWGKKPKIDEVYFLYYQDQDSMVQEFRSGLVDGIFNVPPAQMKPLSKTSGVAAISFTVPLYDYLAFNCYQGKSLGNPVLRDADFRRALAWAIDQKKILQISYGGLAEIGSTIITPGTGGTNVQYHWQPPADKAYGFDLARAAAMLDAAGYKDTDGDGIREADGKPINLRLWARSESASSQKSAKLIAGWFGQLGLHITLTVMDEGAMSDKLYNFEGDTYVPDYDMYLWDVYGYQDPGDTAALYTTEQISLWNDACWSNAEYDRLAVEQGEQLDVEKRKELLWRMQEIFYADVPLYVLAYPYNLEAYDIKNWQGWVRSPQGTGGAFYTNNNMDTYVTVQRVAEKASSGVSPWVFIGIAAAAVVVAAAVLLLLRRRRAEAKEEM